MCAFESYGPSWVVVLALRVLLALVFTCVWGRFPAFEAVVLYFL